MGLGTDLRDRLGFGDYIRTRVLPLAPPGEPVPFRGQSERGAEALPFCEEMEDWLLSRPRAVWSVTGSHGTGKTHLAHWAAARWGARFLEDPEAAPAVLRVDARWLRETLESKAHSPRSVLPFLLAADFSSPFAAAAAPALADHPVVAIVDKDEYPELSTWSLEPPAGFPDAFRILYLAAGEPLPGPGVRLAPWDRETALLAAHRHRGAEGVKRFEALERSPCAPLATYPWFLGWLFCRDGIDAEAVANGRALLDFLRDLQAARSEGDLEPADWWEKLLSSPHLPPARRALLRRLHLEEAPGPEGDWGRVFRAYLLCIRWNAGLAGRELKARRLSRHDLDLIERTPVEPLAIARLEVSEPEGEVEAANLVNLHWRLARTPVGERLLRLPLSGVFLRGHPFTGKLRRIDLTDSDLNGVSCAGCEALECRFSRCTFRAATFQGAVFRHCFFGASSMALADFSGSIFEGGGLTDLSLAETILEGAVFRRVHFSRVVFGPSAERAPPRFWGCTFEECETAGLAACGFLLESCVLSDMSLAGLAPTRFEAEGTSFRRCDGTGLRAPRVRLARSVFRDCLLGGVDLHGADLRDARLLGVDFQPGPGSRSGLTAVSSRGDPIHGSKSGFYAQSLAEGVYDDPEVLRLADLRRADLRGAMVEHTDLFRVDLRGALLDPPLREEAARMGAFLD